MWCLLWYWQVVLGMICQDRQLTDGIGSLFIDPSLSWVAGKEGSRGHNRRVPMNTVKPEDVGLSSLATF